VVGWLLDTNIVSEWIKPKQDRRVADFLSGELKTAIYMSQMTIVELKRGIHGLPDSALKSRLAGWLETTLIPDFATRILAVDEAVLDAALILVDVVKKKQRQIAVADALIAATAAAHNLTIVTRNVKDFKLLDVPLFNPFTGERFNGA
jgi:toxin FitB